MSNSVSRISHTAPPRRYLALWFPYLTTDRLHRQRRMQHGAVPDDRPLVVTEKINGALRIVACDRSAAELGLTIGLTLADARARVADISVEHLDVQADRHFISRLADICSRFTPSVAFDLPAGLMLDITGCGHLFAGEAELRKRVLSSLRAIGLAARASIAGTPDSARALARFSARAIAPPGLDEAFVKPLPVRALADLPEETVIALARAGLKRIGDLSERPPEVLSARFGQSLVACLRRTLGQEDVRITPLRPVPYIALEKQFAEPFTQMDALQGILSSLLDDAALIMQERDEGGRAFEAHFFRSDGAVRRLDVRTGRPSRDRNAILILFQERLATLADPLDPGFGFDAIRLAVPVTEALHPAQPGLDDDAPRQAARDAHALGDLIDHLIVRFGRDRVVRFEPCDSHDPASAVKTVSAADAIALGASDKATIARWQPPEPHEPPQRPLQLFKTPQPIDALAEVPDGPPLRFRWRRVVHVVTRAEGPERIAAEWWRMMGDADARDYYRVEDAGGRRFWIFRQGHYGQADAHPRWFVHGVFA